HNFLVRSMTQLAALRAELVVCVSTALAEQLWIPRRKTYVIPSGVDTSVFFPRDQEGARSALGWEAEEIVVLFNAGLAPIQKGLPLVERAVQQLSEQGIGVRLIVIEGQLSRAQVALYMNAANCLVLASESEGSPNVVKEAMA